MNWKVDNNLIVFSDTTGNLFYPNAEEILRQKDEDKYTFQNETYKTFSEETGITISTLSLNYNPVLVLVDEKIEFYITAEKKGEKVTIPFNNGAFLDYAIINNRFFYLSQSIITINEILKKYSITDNTNLDYVQYMNIAKDCKLSNIELLDNVKEVIKENSNTAKLNGLNATLYPYQENGYNWLKFMTNNGCGSVLADEMGLGKTLQIISLFGYLIESHKGKHFLVVAPVSLLVNWQREIKKFYPSLSCYIYHGKTRTGNFNDILPYDVVITSYSYAVSDLSMFNQIDWDLLILDEAQNIKNPSAQRTKAVKMLKHKVGIAVTGTPFENHMTDIWSLMDFVIPGFFGTQYQFESLYEDTLESAENIEEYLSPLMLRRLVKDVAKDLPERIDIPHPIEMTDEEANLYESQRKEFITADDLKPASLGEIQKLRMFCTHPAVYDKSNVSTDPITISNKYQRLCEIIDEIVNNHEKVIIFTSFNEMINIMMTDLNSRFHVKTFFINGSINANNRQDIVDDFSATNGAAILILNPIAAGTGLNITAANHVIHYTLEWNPALEDQASARAYRRGQSKNVFIHRLIYINTIDEIINDRIAKKRMLSSAAVVGNDGTNDDKQDLIRALSISPIGV